MIDSQGYFTLLETSVSRHGNATDAMSAWRHHDMRIDVCPDPGELVTELATLYTRMQQPGDRLHNMPEIETAVPELVLRYREADGEYYVYVEDTAQQRLAGYTVFNRLIELSRQADPWLRAPHSKYAEAYQRRGLATAIYRWGLDAGMCLMAGARQSAGAHALWRALARGYALGYTDIRRKRLTWLGESVPEAVFNDLHTRMILLGRGWTLHTLADATQMAGT